MRRDYKAVTGLFTLLLLLALPVIGLGEQDLTGEELQAEEKIKKQQLDEMVVTSRKIEERLSAELGEVGHFVEVITGEEMEEAGFVDLNMALRSMIPGLYSETRSGRGGYNSTSIHGSDDILWLLDGVRINNRLYGGEWLYY